MSETVFWTLISIAITFLITGILIVCKLSKRVLIAYILIVLSVLLAIISLIIYYIPIITSITTPEEIVLDNSPDTPSPTINPTDETVVGTLQVAVYDWCGSVIPNDVTIAKGNQDLGLFAPNIVPTLYLRDISTNEVLYVISEKGSDFMYVVNGVKSGSYIFEVSNDDYFTYSKEITLDSNELDADNTWKLKAYMKPSPITEIGFSINVLNSDGNKVANREYYFCTMSYRALIRSDENGEIPYHFIAKSGLQYYLIDVATNESGVVSPSYDGENITCNLKSDQIAINRLNISFEEWFLDNTIGNYTCKLSKNLPDLYPEVIIKSSIGYAVNGRYTANGYSCDDIQDGKYSVSIIADGYEPYTYNFRVRGDEYTVGQDTWLANQKQWEAFIPLEKKGQITHDFTIIAVDIVGNPIGNTKFVIGNQYCITESESNGNGELKSKLRAVAGEYIILFLTDDTYNSNLADLRGTPFSVNKDGEIIVELTDSNK